MAVRMPPHPTPPLSRVILEIFCPVRPQPYVFQTLCESRKVIQTKPKILTTRRLDTFALTSI
jgi:hypothetical protein